MTAETMTATHAYVAPRVLLAEDDYELRRLVAGALRGAGFDVVETRDGRELLEQVGSALLDRQHHYGFDLVISDIRMPGQTGMEILSGLARSQITAPVLLITAFGDEHTHQLATQLGTAGVLDKPVDLDDLITLMVETLWHPAARRRHQRPPGRRRKDSQTSPRG